MKSEKHRTTSSSQPARDDGVGTANSRAPIPGWLMAALLAFVTAAAYWPALQCGFVDYDDNLYVTSNLHVQNGLTLASMKWACVNPVAGNWHPLTLWSHMADCQLFGLKPWGHHLTSLLLHAFNTALVFLLLRSWTGAFWRSALVAGLFGLHPLHVESVAWVAERKDVLSTCCGLLSLVFYARHARGRLAVADRGDAPRGPLVFRRFNYLLALIFYTLGLMSKPMLVTWPFVMLLLDYWPLERLQTTKPWKLVVEKIPFFALAAVASVVTFVVQKQDGSLMATQALPFAARAGNALISYCRYLAKLFWPSNLAIFYPHPMEWPLLTVLLAGMVMLGLSVALCWHRRRYPFLFVGWLWFCGTLVPVIGLVQMGLQAMADRYAYIPSLGVLILTVWGMGELAKSWNGRAVAGWGMGLTALALCLFLTRQQLHYWKDTEALFQHALAVTENNYLAHLNLGSALDKKGRIDGAILEYRAAIGLKPDYVPAHDDLGAALVKKGEIDEGIREHREAIRLKPDYAQAHCNLSLALMMKGALEEATRECREAIRLNPNFAEAHCNLGIALTRKGDLTEGIQEFEEAVRLKPDLAEAHNDLGSALLKAGQIEPSIAEFREAVRVKPDFPEAHCNLGTGLARKGDLDQAIREFEAAVRLKPDFPEARASLARALALTNPTPNR